MGRASELVNRLGKLAKRGRISSAPEPRSGQDFVAGQLPMFGERLVVLAQTLDKAQRRIGILTWVIAALTAVLAIDTVSRFNLHR